MGVLWDPSLPGAGAQRAVLLLQLYMRMGHYSSLSVLVADALALTFKAGGATIAELSVYLGLAINRIEIGIGGMPREIYCTSAELSPSEVGGEIEKEFNTTKKRKREGGEESSLRYYINYASLLPFVFAHTSHMLLTLCLMPLPPPSSSSSSNGGVSNERATLNISQTVRRVDCSHGLCCASCRYWMSLKDLRSTILRCPLCQSDILDLVLCAIKARYDEKLSKGQSLLSFGPLQQQASKDSGRTAENAKKAGEKLYSEDFSDVPLARDPFLVQQALFFKFLYSHPFVCVNDAAFVVDADEVMTKEEYDYRSKHRATVLDQFRLAHRNCKSIYVERVDQETLDAERCEASLMKLAKRLQLPPWLRPVSLFSEDKEKLSSDVDDDKVAAAPASVGGEERTATRTKGRSEIVAAAKYIAREYFDDDYDEVPLLKSYKC